MNKATVLQEKLKLYGEIKAQAGEERDLSKVTALQGTDAEKFEALEKLSGEIKSLQAEVTKEEEAFNIDAESELKAIKKPTNLPAIINPNTGTANELPSTARKYSSLKSFKGANADLQAYRFGQWFMASVGASKTASQYCADHGIEVKTLKEGINQNGGFLVPDEFDNTLIDLREQYGVFRRNAKVVPMASDTKTMPRRTGGVTAYFLGESDAITASDKTWDRVQLVAKKVGALTKISSELNEDAVINLGDDIAGEIGYAFAYLEDNCGFNADGSSTYGGIVGAREKLKNVNASIASIKGLQVASGNAYSEITLSDFNSLVAKLPLYARKNAKFYCSATVHDSVMQKLAYAAGGVTGAEIINGAPILKFLGYPVELVQVMPTAEANSQVCVLFGDLSMAAMLGDRRQNTIKISDVAGDSFVNDEVWIRGTQRFDINVHDVGDTSVAGPLLGLITAAS